MLNNIDNTIEFFAELVKETQKKNISEIKQMSTTVESLFKSVVVNRKKLL